MPLTPRSPQGQSVPASFASREFGEKNLEFGPSPAARRRVAASLGQGEAKRFIADLHWAEVLLRRLIASRYHYCTGACL